MSINISYLTPWKIFIYTWCIFLLKDDILRTINGCEAILFMICLNVILQNIIFLLLVITNLTLFNWLFFSLTSINFLGFLVYFHFFNHKFWIVLFSIWVFFFLLFPLFYDLSIKGSFLWQYKNTSLLFSSSFLTLHVNSMTKCNKVSCAPCDKPKIIGVRAQWSYHTHLYCHREKTLNWTLHTPNEVL